MGNHLNAFTHSNHPHLSTQPNMSEGSNQPHHENFVERFFDHHHHHNKNQDNQNQSGGQQGEQQQGQQKPEHKESEMDKVRDYIKEDERIEQEGGPYGGLM